MIFQRNINCLPLACPQLRTWLVTQACALTRNRTSGLLVCRITANPLSHAGQSRNFPFGLKESSQPLSLPLQVLFTSQALNRDYFSKGSSQSLSNVLKTISQCCACTSTEHIAYTVCFHSQCCAHYHLQCGRLFLAGSGTASLVGVTARLRGCRHLVHTQAVPAFAVRNSGVMIFLVFLLHFPTTLETHLAGVLSPNLLKQNNVHSPFIVRHRCTCTCAHTRN